MTTGRTLLINNTEYDCSTAVGYHYGHFPPSDIDLHMVFEPLTKALEQLARYDEKLQNLVNAELLLAPLRQRDAVVSSRMEGTISTLEEVLRLEASENAKRTEGTQRDQTIEVALYARSLRQTERQMSEGYPLSETLLRNAHRTLLSHGRGAEKQPGAYKTRQNYIGDQRQRRVEFIPIAAEALPEGMAQLLEFIRTDSRHPLLKAAIAHAEFEALHPFDDGNGRIGRMMIPLMLWSWGVLQAPYFFVSDYFERNKDEYIERMRRVSSHQEWGQWCCFFLDGLTAQAAANIDTVARIQSHYETTKEHVQQTLRSQHYLAAVDYIFANPVFWNNHFVQSADAPDSTLRNFTPRLVDAGLIDPIIPPAGRAPGLYAFSSLLEILKDAG